MTPRPLGSSIHVALAVPTAACVAPALAIDDLGGTHRETVFAALTAGAGVIALVMVVILVVRWCGRRSPFHLPARAGSGYETCLAGITGLCLGAYAGVMHDVEVQGLHFSAAASYFALLPLALLVCCSRRPAWRPFLDVTVLMAGTEIGAQAGMMLTKWHEVRWWDDVTGIDVACWLGALVAATFWTLVQRRGVDFAEHVRVRATVEAGDTVPPRKA